MLTRMGGRRTVSALRVHISAFLNAEHFRNFRGAHPVEIIRYGNLASQKAQAPNMTAIWRIQCDDFDERFPGLRNYERFAIGCLLNQPREMSFCFVNIDDPHAESIKLSPR